MNIHVELDSLNKVLLVLLLFCGSCDNSSEWTVQECLCLCHKDIADTHFASVFHHCSCCYDVGIVQDLWVGLHVSLIGSQESNVSLRQ
ncbi:hypothetical protein PGT21_024756 [Puccinia graminis f. sp. tritici]|uniref:Secreted protein n=1 Tax=Puccinia graminis f. sp. tritici TaxID=56615 RepID=A0A5B0LQ50_PUCGR|nr:hypothetical protein PGT21_024756 [Puccinia graminis f. sp. tritici]